MKKTTPLAAINRMRLTFAPTSPVRGRPLANANPESPAVASAGISRTKPHGIAVLTMVTVAWDANSSLITERSFSDPGVLAHSTANAALGHSCSIAVA